MSFSDQKKVAKMSAQLSQENPFVFAAKRYKEMSQLMDSLRNPNQTKLVFQSLPKHMRRRTATQNAKRLPKRLRSAHVAQLRKSGMPVKAKRPSRKYRRKPSNLRQEYGRRQADKLWLQTHVWHAKRFHMETKWGHRLPVAPCDKSFRACYRAITKHCLIQDQSFYRTFEVEGSEEDLKGAFRRITSSKCGLTIIAKSYIEGKRQGDVYLFDVDRYPEDCIGKVAFIWLPRDAADSRRIWFTFHPSMTTAIEGLFSKLFILTKTEDSVYSSHEAKINVRDLTGTINRFRLSGRLAHKILSNALLTTAVSTGNDFWNLNKLKANIASDFPPRMILSVQTEDPRLSRPDKKQSPLRSISNIRTEFIDLPDNVNSSQIYDADTLKGISGSILSNTNYCKQRHAEIVVPGERCSSEQTLQQCPVLLIQRPGNLNPDIGPIGFNSGWDVVIPQGYGMHMWLTLIMYGGRAGGLREENESLREVGLDNFPPDSCSGKYESEAQYETLRSRYFRKPFNKRPNYTKLSISSPFKAPWLQLIQEWNTDHVDSFYVIRDRDVLLNIMSCLKQNMENIEQFRNALVPITFRMLGRGKAASNAIICVPVTKDITTQRAAHSDAPIFTEPLANDPREKERKLQRKNHKLQLAQLRRKRLRIKRRLQLRSTKKVKIERSKVAESLVVQQYNKSCEQWIPCKPTAVRHQCSRETIGYATSCAFSYVRNSICGAGYVTFPGFVAWLQAVRGAKQPFVLVRGPQTRHYRGAEMKITMPS